MRAEGPKERPTTHSSSTTMCLIKSAKRLASFPVLPCTRFTFTCDNCGGEHFETGYIPGLKRHVR